MATAYVSGIYVYPVKSMGGIAPRSWTLTSRGLLHDRRWMVVRANGRFVTQRDQPALARIRTALDNHGVTLSAEGHGSSFIPFESEGGEVFRTRVWKDDCEVVDEGPELSRWLTAAVGSEEPLRIARMAPGFRRRLAASDRYGEEVSTLFADSAPLLVANEASLEHLNQALRARGLDAVPMNRFRPNIVLRGPDAFGEHRLRQVEGDGWRLGMVDACERCLVTTVDQSTGERDPGRQPYLTLREVNPVREAGSAPAFGQNAIVTAGEGTTITVGEQLTVR